MEQRNQRRDGRRGEAEDRAGEPAGNEPRGGSPGRPRWLAQRRARIALGGVIGVVGLGGAVLAATPRDPVNEAARAVVLEAMYAERDVVWDLPNLEHERVDFWVDRFTTVPDMREKMDGFLQRAGRYVPMLVEKLDERGMPRDLIYLAMIESGFQPHAYSPAAASGLWQFIAETGQRYGLDIDRAVDERNDPVKATDAALDYLEDLHGRFGSWYLAAAAYNTGENRVGRIMREEFGREEAASEEDYYRIWSRLPSETRDYVPLMIAAARIAKEPHTYGFAHVEPLPPLEYDEILVPPATQLADIADAAGVAVDDIEALNPHFRIGRTPNDRDYPVRIPPGSLRALASTWGLALPGGLDGEVAAGE